MGIADQGNRLLKYNYGRAAMAGRPPRDDGCVTGALGGPPRSRELPNSTPGPTRSCPPVPPGDTVILYRPQPWLRVLSAQSWSPATSVSTSFLDCTPRWMRSHGLAVWVPSAKPLGHLEGLWATPVSRCEPLILVDRALRAGARGCTHCATATPGTNWQTELL